MRRRACRTSWCMPATRRTRSRIATSTFRDASSSFSSFVLSMIFTAHSLPSFLQVAFRTVAKDPLHDEAEGRILHVRARKPRISITPAVCRRITHVPSTSPSRYCDSQSSFLHRQWEAKPRRGGLPALGVKPTGIARVRADAQVECT